MSDPGLLVLSRSDIARLMSYEDYVVAVEAAFVAAESGRAVAPPAAALHVPDGSFHAKGAALLGEGAVTAILTQAEFLARLGVGERAEALVRARPDKAGLVGRQLNRLVAAEQMGELFKACAIHSPDWTPPAFEDA